VSADEYTRAYVASAHASHLITADGASLCGAQPRAGRGWLGTEGRHAAQLAAKPLCTRCQGQADVLRQLAAGGVAPPPRPGVVAIVMLWGRRWPVADCIDCGRLRVVASRGLCMSCQTRHVREGDLSEWGYVRADRLAEFADLRRGSVPVTEAAARVGVSARTGQRYERDLRQAAA